VSLNDGHTYGSTAGAYDPTNHGNLFGIADVPTSSQTAAVRSGDGGTTWATTGMPLPSSPPNQFSTEPATAFDSAGALYAVSMGVTLSGSSISTQIVLSRSLDKGATWTNLSVVEGPARLPERPSIAIDTTNSPYHGRIYVAYATNPRDNARSQPVILARSDDGVTWRKTQLYDKGGDIGADPRSVQTARSTSPGKTTVAATTSVVTASGRMESLPSPSREMGAPPSSSAVSLAVRPKARVPTLRSATGSSSVAIPIRRVLPTTRSSATRRSGWRRIEVVVRTTAASISPSPTWSG